MTDKPESFLPSEPEFLTVAEVTQLHAEQLAAFGGQDGLREPGLLESAVIAAQNVYSYTDGDLFDMAAAYAFHIAENQPFIDGNKRTGLQSSLAFLNLNGYSVSDPSMALFDAMHGFASKTLDKDGFAALLRSLAH